MKSPLRRTASVDRFDQEDVRAGGAIERVAFRFPLGEGDVSRVFSGVLYLRDRSPLQASYPIDMLTARIAPSLALAQFSYYVDEVGAPVGFCNWAWLSPAVLNDVLANGRDLRESEFDCGDQPFFYEFLAPFGHGRQMVRALRALPFFVGRRIPALRAKLKEGGAIVSRVASFDF
jgi:cytolysin-activating lysine-acyltransferase